MERNSVPLVMLPHNIEALLKADEGNALVPCNGICLRHDPNSSHGVLLIVNMDDAQREFALENFGFKAAGQ